MQNRLDHDVPQQQVDDQQQVDELTSSALKGGLHDSKWSSKEYKPDPNRKTHAQLLQEASAKLLHLELFADFYGMQSWLDSEVRVPQQADNQQEADDQQQEAEDQQQKADDQQQVDELTSSALKGGLHDSKWSKKEYKPDPNTKTHAQVLQEASARLLHLE
jgi:hypothetical protein